VAKGDLSKLLIYLIIIYFFHYIISSSQKKDTMVKIGLQICATLDNIEELKTCHPNYSFFIKIKCTNCGECSDKWHDLIESERIGEDSRNPKGFNFAMKCKLCSRDNSLDVLEGSNGKFIFNF
jgi:hypothetical protein